MRKIREDHREELNRLKNHHNYANEKDEKERKINERKKEIRDKIEENLQNSFDHELRLI